LSSVDKEEDLHLRAHLRLRRAVPWEIFGFSPVQASQCSHASG